MMVTGITSFGRVQGIYVYGSPQYNRAADTAVAPVSKVPPVAKVDEDRLQFAVTYRSKHGNQSVDEMAALREQESLAANYKNQNIIQYDLANPYEQARMSMERSLLMGINFNMLA